MIDHNSLCYWFPLLEQYKDHINYPKTIIYPLNHLNPIEFLDHNIQAISSFQINDMPKIEHIFHTLGFPLFMKTDQFSGKHSWEKTCFIPNRTVFFRNLCQLIEESYCADFFGLPLNALVFRKYIPLESPFSFFYGNMPVAKERRYFIQNKKLLCHHPYWDKAVFLDYMDKVIGKRDDEKLRMIDEINIETPEEIELLSNYCKTILPSFPEFWSIDFAYGKDKKWYLIDMAKGMDSWHPNCPFNLRNKLK